MLIRTFAIVTVLGSELAMADPFAIVQTWACTPDVRTCVQLNGSSSVPDAALSVTITQISGSAQASATYGSLTATSFTSFDNSGTANKSYSLAIGSFLDT